jgi:ATP-binding cassette, subfamily C, bacterial
MLGLSKERTSGNAKAASSLLPDVTKPFTKRFIAFIREFTQCVGPSALAAALVLVLLSAATEGIGLALLVPLVQSFGDSGQVIGGLGFAVRQALSTVGLPASLSALLAVFVGLIVLRAILVAVRDITLARLRLDFINVFRRRVYKAIAEAPWSLLMRHRLSDFLEVLTTQIGRISAGSFFFLRLPAVIVLAAVQIGVAFILSPLLTVGVFCWGGLLLALLQRLSGSRYREGLKYAEASRKTFAEISDFLHALKLAKSYNVESRHIVAFEAAMERENIQSVALDRSTMAMRLAIQIGAAVTLGAVVYLGATIGQVGLAGLLVMIVIFSRLAPLISEFQQGWQSVEHMLPAFDRVMELWKLCAAAAEPVSYVSGRVDLRHEIALRDVRFSYNNEAGPDTLEALDLVIPAGATIAIVGPTGAGKSTLADLLLGILTPDTGAVLIDGVPLTGAVLARWRRSIGYVPQDNFLFNDTIRANLLWAFPEAREQDIEWALSVAAADRFVAKLPDGLETVIAERGLRLSGGERQRLGLARALLRRPTLLILDEATSALDNETERAVQTAIDRLHGSVTMVLIAHRLSTVRGADRILVLDRGRLVQAGPWDTLVQDPSGAFAALLGKHGAHFVDAL